MVKFEERFQIESISDIIAQFQEAYPQAQLTKLQLSYKGPFLRYSLVGFDSSQRYSVTYNANTGDLIKEKAKELSPKQLMRLKNKTLDVNHLLSMDEIQEIAEKTSELEQAIQWELDQKKGRTLWIIEFVKPDGSNIIEIKIDAQDGTVLQMKLKT
ncbi:PepSY domain-containing protein [Aerococcaceae bacterium DSM 111020]|nr:PepSY domain-containing protein [Aerococcaceae bacterium DSM 111020]